MTCTFCKSKIITVTAHHLLILLENISSSVIIQGQLPPDNSISSPREQEWVEILCSHPGPPSQDLNTRRNLVLSLSKRAGNQASSGGKVIVVVQEPFREGPDDPVEKPR